MQNTKKRMRSPRNTFHPISYFSKIRQFTEHMMKERISLNFELAIETLVGLGFKPTDAQIYIFLAKKGPKRGKDLVTSLKLTKQQLYPSLKNLQKRGIVHSTHERPAIFSAVSIERVLDTLIKTKIEETQRLIQNKEEAISKWKSMMHNDSKI
jgi:sugar-specific transcriptional regulator TrmB